MARGLSDALGALDLDERDSSLDLALIISSVEAVRPDVADELQSLQAIFGLDESTPTLSLYRPAPTARTPSPPDWSPSSPDPLRLILRLTLPDPHEEHAMHLLLSLPPGYPSSAPPLLQLQDRYLSSFAVDDELFGAVLRTYMHDSEAGVAAGVVEWTGDVCLYEGIEAVREKCGQWVKERAEEKQRGEERRQGNGEEEVMGRRSAGFRAEDYEDEDEDEELEERIEEIERGPRLAPVATVKCPKITSAEPLVDRKSVSCSLVPFPFSPRRSYSPLLDSSGVHWTCGTGDIGRRGVCSLPVPRLPTPQAYQRVSQVNAVMAELLSNSRIARATYVSSHRAPFSSRTDSLLLIATTCRRINSPLPTVFDERTMTTMASRLQAVGLLSYSH